MPTYWIVEGDGPAPRKQKRPPEFRSTTTSPDGETQTTLRHYWGARHASLSVIGPTLDGTLAEYWRIWNERKDEIASPERTP